MAAVLAARRTLATLLVGLCLVGTGCSRDSGPEPAPSGLDPARPSITAPGPSAGQGVELGDARALISMPWKLTAISPDRRTITVQYISGDGSCLKHVGYHLEQDGQALRLGEYSRTNNDPACPAKVEGGSETIPLPVALDGGVQLIHIPASQEWSRFLE